MMGTPIYMAPEQMIASSDVDPRTDVWSMGALLYELVSGELPFRGETELQIFANVMTKPPVPFRAHSASTPPEVEALVLKCLRKNREDRFPSMPALASALRAAIASPG
jgi:serine/threonine protein kinase